MNGKPVAIITGASSGIGAATARLFGAQGYRLALAARRLDRLEELGQTIATNGGESVPIQTDLTRPGDLQTLVDTTLDRYGQIDVLVNNAGFGRILPLVELDPETDIAPQFAVNLLGPVFLTRLVIPHMAARGQGHIIHISSLAGFLATPSYTVYAATKFGLRGFSEALRREVRQQGIRVSAIYPGSVRTEFSLHMGRKKKPRYTTPDWLVLSPEEVARTILQVARHPRRETVIPSLLRVILFLGLHFPRLADRLIDLRTRPRES